MTNTKERDEVLEKALNALKQFSNVDLWANTCCGCDPAYYPRASIEDKTFSMAELAEKTLEEIDQTIKKIKAASSGQDRVLSDNVARGCKGDVG